MSESPLLQLSGLSLFYGAFQALKGVTLTLPPGRIGLLGPNGAGKSSLLKVLLGLISPSSGSGTLMGRDITWGGVELRRLIGFMPEADALVPGLKGAEYVALAGELYGMPRREAQRRAHEILTNLGLDEARYRQLEEYSTGMKQRLKLAQALVHDPPLLLLDEPTSGLDPTGRDAMLQLLFSLGRDHGKSFILSTHLLGDVDRVCDRVVILHHGEVLLDDALASLRGRRQDRYRLQVEGNAQPFLQELALEGVRVLADNKKVIRVAVPPGWSTRVFFALAENTGVALRAMEPDEEDLEELFHRVLKERGA